MPFLCCPLIFSQLLATVCFCCIFFSSSFFIFLLAFVFIGIEEGITYFSSLFHSLNGYEGAGVKSGVHEMMIGTGILTGSLRGGIFAEVCGLRTPYLLVALVTVGAVIVELSLIKLAC